ncbi:hypothetical protein [Cellulosilyticum ruminicola]|uniref:hypothetical protein n=1 Tax=Cellulosilyticum ruminicola TaxID=425254 RepID=UPI0006D075ED|nr:hypothetical protein [Cellulosilyticum ruminicola]
MMKRHKSDEEIQREYSKIILQYSKHILFIPVLVILFIIGAATDKWWIFQIGVVPILVYFGWFNLVVYRCPNCGHRLGKYQMYNGKCNWCHADFFRKDMKH